MKADIIEIGENDKIMIHHDIGNMPPEDVDKYCEKLMKKFISIFGTGHVSLFPVRDGKIWDFTIIKVTITKK